MKNNKTISVKTASKGQKGSVCLLSRQFSSLWVEFISIHQFSFDPMEVIPQNDPTAEGDELRQFFKAIQFCLKKNYRHLCTREIREKR
jgi:hypothetical protein